MNSTPNDPQNVSDEAVEAAAVAYIAAARCTTFDQLVEMQRGLLRSWMRTALTAAAPHMLAAKNAAESEVWIARAQVEQLRAALNFKNGLIEDIGQSCARAEAEVARLTRERDEARSSLERLESDLAAMCDDDWLRRRDRCMELNGTHARHDRSAAGAWEQAAHRVRGLLGEDYEDRIDRHDTYLQWLRGDRDRGQAERGEVPVEKRYRGWPTQARVAPAADRGTETEADHG